MLHCCIQCQIGCAWDRMLPVRKANPTCWIQWQCELHTWFHILPHCSPLLCWILWMHLYPCWLTSFVIGTCVELLSTKCQLTWHDNIRGRSVFVGVSHGRKESLSWKCTWLNKTWININIFPYTYRFVKCQFWNLVDVWWNSGGQNQWVTKSRCFHDYWWRHRFSWVEMFWTRGTTWAQILLLNEIK